MQPNPSVPGVEDVQRITRIQDPVIRNLQITQCYHELSAAFASRTGLAANWCTFATWASRQAGETIRKEDLARLLESHILQSPAAAQASENVNAAIDREAGGQAIRPKNPAQMIVRFTAVMDRASDAVSRGNKKVFEEIGLEFARFLQDCFTGEQVDPSRVAIFCESLRAGEPPDGQDYLRRAFLHYAQALTESDAKARAELMLLANVEIGFHEQTRLQPEIAESLNAGMLGFSAFARPLFQSIFPANSWLQLARVYLQRLLGRPTALDRAVQALLAEVSAQLRQVITGLMMRISLPSGEVLMLGEDLRAGFPESLRKITNPELSDFLAQFDLTPDSPSRTGALDWADLPERLHYILDLFRCYQERRNLFDPPFTPEQVVALKAGRRPQGRL